METEWASGEDTQEAFMFGGKGIVRRDWGGFQGETDDKGIV